MSANEATDETVTTTEDYQDRFDRAIREATAETLGTEVVPGEMKMPEGGYLKGVAAVRLLAKALDFDPDSGEDLSELICMLDNRTCLNDPNLKLAVWHRMIEFCASRELPKR